ncbi:hypothetical protein PENTCL1PPCAC_20126, partial [Pristionchus entomophagus]
GFEVRISHEVINALLCVALIVYISRNFALKIAYKFNLLPLLIALIVQSCAHAAFYSTPFAICHFDKTGMLFFSEGVLMIIYASKQYFILHSLVRPSLIARFSTIGLIASIIVPVILFSIPAPELIFKIEIFPSHRISYWLVCICGFVNFGISAYWILSGQIEGSSFPVIIAAYELSFAFPEAIKLIFMFHTDDFGAYVTLEDFDDVAFLITALFSFVVLVLENRRKHRVVASANEWISFGNQNSYSNCEDVMTN